MSQNHLVPLSTNGWSLWKWFQLRSAGFPAAGARELGNPDIHEQLDQLHIAGKNYSSVGGRIERRLAELVAGNDVQLAHDAERNKHRLSKQKALSPIGDKQFDNDLEELESAKQTLDAMQKAMFTAFDEELLRSSGVLRSYAESPLFREAIAWQNHGVLGSAIASYLRSEPGANNAKARDRQRLLAKYIQRYSLKNDTIGFFGPTTWGEVDADCAGFESVPGPLIIQRAAFFEYWLVGTLTEQLDQRPEVLPICSLRLRLGARVAGTEYILRDGTKMDLTEAQAFILDLANQTDTIHEIASRTVEKGLAASDEAVYALVRELVRGQFATAKIEVPTEICHPETWLHDLLRQLPESEVRDEALATLATLEAGLKAVSEAAGDEEKLCAAIRNLEQDFKDTTAMAAKRAHGLVYAGRQIFYEECVRGGEVTIGRRFLDSISVPLGFVLASARWFTFHIGRKYRKAFSDVFNELAAQSSDSTVSLMNFQIGIMKHFTDDKGESEIIASVQSELKRRWAEVLQVDESVSQVSLRSEDLAERVAELFAAPGPGWPTARYQSPDIMLVANSVEDVAQGNFQAVLGELHCGTNTIPAMSPFSLHPKKEEIAEAVSEDLGAASISPVQTSANRVAVPAIAPDAINLEDKAARSWRPREQVLISGDLYVQEREGELEVVSHRTGQSFDVIRFMDYLLSNAALANFSLLPKKRHMPRVTIDKLIISRERWTYKRADYADLLTTGNTPAERFIAVSKWVRDQGLPRFMFAVVPNEPKPLYVDFASITLVDVLLLFLAKASTLSLSEMLPKHHEHWLVSDTGERYASELRFVAVDPVVWTPDL